MGDRDDLKPLVLIPDEPVADHKDDILGLKPFTMILAETALGSPGPFTIGVYGDWGAGKTSVLRQAMSRIDASEFAENTVTVWFNAWQYENEEHLIVPLLLTIARAIENRKSRFNRVLGKAYEELAAALNGISVAYSALGGLSFQLSPKDAREYKEKLQEQKNRVAGYSSLYFQAFEALENITKNPVSDTDHPKIIIFIDDLDRTLPDKVLKLLEGIKLVLSQPGFVFALGLNPTILTEFLTKTLTEDYGVRNEQAPSLYLDKIVQLPLPLPSHESRIEGFIKKLLDRYNKNIEEQARNVLEKIKHPLSVGTQYNPRSLVRLINNLLVDQRLFKMTRPADEPGSHTQPEQDDMENVIAICAVSRILQQNFDSHHLYDRFMRDNNLCEEIMQFGSIDLLILEKEDKWRSRPEYKESDPDEIILKKLTSSPHLGQLLKDTEPGKVWLTNNELRLEVNEFIQKERPETVSDIPKDQAEIINGAIRQELRIKKVRQITDGDRKNVKRIYLSFSDIDDSGLSLLKDMTNLEMLDISKTQITNSGLAQLKGMKNLKTLLLSNTQITDAGLAHLEGLTNLKGLDLDNTHITDSGLEYLEGMKNLEKLGLDNTPITDDGLAHLKGLTNLEVLGLTDTPITDAGLAHLKGLTNLMKLVLSNTPITDAGLAHLKGLTNLKTLVLSNTQITGEGLEYLEGMTSLYGLDLKKTKITDEGLAHLEEMKNLGQLWLSETKITDAGLAYLEGMTNLKILVLYDTDVTEAGVEKLIEALPNLNKKGVLFGKRPPPLDK